MVEDQKITPRLSERFSDLFGVDDQTPRGAGDSDVYPVYLEESRKLNLNKLLHLAPYSEVLLLLGEPGVGRSTLLRSFVQRAATSWRISFVSAGAAMDGVTLLRQIGSGFDLDLAQMDAADDLLWEIDRYLQALGRSGRRAIIIVDDAHLLGDEVILLLEKILRDTGRDDSVSLVLSMRQDQGGKLERFALLKERLAYTIRLEPLSRKEVDGYLRQRLAATTAQPDLLLTREAVEAIHRDSGGLPEQVNGLAQQLLVTRKTAAASRGGKRSLWTISAAVLVILGVGVVLFYQDEINRLLETPAPRSAEDAGGSSDLSLGAVPPAPLDQDETVARLEDESGAPLDLPLPEETIVGEAEQVPPPASPEPESMTETLPAAPDTEMPAETGSPPVPSEPPPAPAPPEAPATPAPTEAPAPTAEVPPASAPEPELSPQMEWLLAQPENHYTLQLMALADESDVTGFVAQHGIADQSATFPITRRGRVLTVLVYGSYPNRAAANQAAAGLPKSWGVKQPWVRRFAGVRRDLAEG